MLVLAGETALNGFNTPSKDAVQDVIDLREKVKLLVCRNEDNNKSDHVTAVSVGTDDNLSEEDNERQSAADVVVATEYPSNESPVRMVARKVRRLLEGRSRTPANQSPLTSPTSKGRRKKACSAYPHGAQHWAARVIAGRPTTADVSAVNESAKRDEQRKLVFDLLRVEVEERDRLHQSLPFAPEQVARLWQAAGRGDSRPFHRLARHGARHIQSLQALRDAKQRTPLHLICKHGLGKCLVACLPRCATAPPAKESKPALLLLPDSPAPSSDTSPDATVEARPVKKEPSRISPSEPRFVDTILMRTSLGYTPLHYAVVGGHARCVEYLLEYYERSGALMDELEATSVKGETAADLADLYEWSGIKSMLVRIFDTHSKRRWAEASATPKTDVGASETKSPQEGGLKAFTKCLIASAFTVPRTPLTLRKLNEFDAETMYAQHLQATSAMQARTEEQLAAIVWLDDVDANAGEKDKVEAPSGRPETGRPIPTTVHASALNRYLLRTPDGQWRQQKHSRFEATQQQQQQQPEDNEIPLVAYDPGGSSFVDGQEDPAFDRRLGVAVASCVSFGRFLGSRGYGGVKVVRIDPNGPLAAAALTHDDDGGGEAGGDVVPSARKFEVGDVITHVNEAVIRDANDLETALAQLQSGGPITVLRGYRPGTGGGDIEVFIRFFPASSPTPSLCKKITRRVKAAGLLWQASDFSASDKTSGVKDVKVPWIPNGINNNSLSPLLEVSALSLDSSVGPVSSMSFASVKSVIDTSPVPRPAGPRPLSPLRATHTGPWRPAVRGVQRI
ncbi:hypothetical protein DIPPA_09719 [Diplonema papillatum]|nr:hypothetical protein DIPPA_09719 [Diplonema papillatum]